MWALGACFYFYEYFLQVSPNVIRQELMRDFDINALYLGNLGAAYFYTYAVMQIPVGLLLDYFGPRRLLTSAAVFCAIGTTVFSLASTYPIAFLGRLLIGFGGAFAAIGVLNISSLWHPERKFALLTGLLLTIGMIGAVNGNAILAYLVSFFGWRQVLFTMGMLGLLLAFFIWLAVRDRPLHHPRPENYHFSLGLRQILRNRQIWLIAIFGGLFFAPVSTFGGLWGASFLSTKFNIGTTVAGSLGSLMFIGFGIAAPFIGYFSERLGNRKLLLYVGTIGAALSLAGVIYLPASMWVIGVGLFFFGFFSSSIILIFPLGSENSSHYYVTTTMGFINALNMVGGALLQPLAGAILDYYWKGETINGARHFSLGSYQTALSILIFSIVFSLLFLFLIKETHCKKRA